MENSLEGEICNGSVVEENGEKGEWMKVQGGERDDE